MALANAMRIPIAAARGLSGKGPCAVVRRDGIVYDLDLREGIDFSIFLLGAFERSTRNTLRNRVRVGATVLDIGANIGAHTLSIARSVGESGVVHAFEPTDFAVEKLRRNLALNPELERRVRVHQTLLASRADAPMPKLIYSSWPLSCRERIHPKHGGRLSTTSNATVDTLDAFAEREAVNWVDLIKIDVDGHEFPVLAGGAKLLARCRPILVMEIAPYVHKEQGNSFDDLITLLSDTGYSLMDERLRRLPLVAGRLTELIPDGSGLNAIATPNRQTD